MGGKEEFNVVEYVREVIGERARKNQEALERAREFARPFQELADGFTMAGEEIQVICSPGRVDVQVRFGAKAGIGAREKALGNPYLLASYIRRGALGWEDAHSLAGREYAGKKFSNLDYLRMLLERIASDLEEKEGV